MFWSFIAGVVIGALLGGMVMALAAASGADRCGEEEAKRDE